jgi:hypothetical protein
MDCARDSEVDATLLSLKKFLTVGLHVRVYLVCPVTSVRHV